MRMSRAEREGRRAKCKYDHTKNDRLKKKVYLTYIMDIFKK